MENFLKYRQSLLRYDERGRSLVRTGVNNQTGELVHKEGSSEPLTKNTSYLGKDGMFGEAGEVIENNGISETVVSPEHSEEIANEGGFEKAKVEIIEKTVASATYQEMNGL